MLVIILLGRDRISEASQNHASDEAWDWNLYMPRARMSAITVA